MAKKSYRVPLPKQPKGQLELAQKIITKHAADGAASALSGIADDWTVVEPRVAVGLDAQQRAEALLREAEKYFQIVRTCAAEVHPMTQRTVKTLEGKFGPNASKKMGDWSIPVHDSPKTVKVAKAPNA